MKSSRGQAIKIQTHDVQAMFPKYLKTGKIQFTAFTCICLRSYYQLIARSQKFSAGFIQTFCQSFLDAMHKNDFLLIHKISKQN